MRILTLAAADTGLEEAGGESEELEDAVAVPKVSKNPEATRRPWDLWNNRIAALVPASAQADPNIL